MPDQPRGVIRLLKPGRARREPQRMHRLANSIRLPWGVGLFALVLLGLLSAVLVGRTGGGPLDVPPVVRDYQESITLSAADSVRRGVNEGVDDLSQLGLSAGAGRLDGERLRRTLGDVIDLQGRYESLYVVDTAGRVVSQTGTPPAPRALDMGGVLGQAGMQDLRRVPGQERAVIAQWAPVGAFGQASTGAVVGHYKPSFLRFALSVARPGAAWVVNRRGQVVGSTEGVSPLSALPRQALREAATRAAAGASGVVTVGGSLERQEVIGFAPITGFGPAGRQGWSVVTTRSVASFPLPQTDARRQGLLAGAITVVITLLVFGWLYIVVINPILRLRKEAERIAYGDLGRNVEVIRYDEIGIVARALERIRILLIRARR